MLSPFDEVSGLGLEERVLVTDGNELAVAVAALVRHACQVGVALLAVLAHNLAVIILVLLQEALSVVVGVYVDLSDCVVSGRLQGPLVYARLQPRQDQLQSVSLLDLLDEFVRVELAAHHQDEVLDDVLGAVHVQ